MKYDYRIKWKRTNERVGEIEKEGRRIVGRIG